ncbi:hypothetical protein KC734_19655 [candidate division KSB1 bacterium]|nr:hypothetical protein [candidate division KSB1 bacterium]
MAQEHATTGEIMFPVGNWIFGLKPAPPPPPKKPFDVFWEALGKFVKKAVVIISALSVLILVYLIGFSQQNMVDFIRNLPFFSSSESSATSTAELPAIPGEKLYAVIVDRVDTEVQGREVISRLRASNIVSSQFFANGQYVIYIGSLSTLSQAEIALQKVQSKGFGRAQIVR